MMLYHLYDNAADAHKAAAELVETGFTNGLVQTVEPGAVDAETLIGRGVSKTHAEGYAARVSQGASLVMVDAPFGSAALATGILGGAQTGGPASGASHADAGPHFNYTVAPKDDAAPFSSAIGMTVLSHDPTPLSSWLKLPLLSGTDAPATAPSSVSRLSANPAPLSGLVGLKLLSNNAAPLSSLTNFKPLSHEAAPLSNAAGVQTLSPQPAPLSAAIGLATLLRSPAPLSSLLGLPVLLRSRSRA